MTARPNPIGEIVASLRTEHGLTQEQLADRAGVDRRTIQRLEKGERISADNITSVAEVLGVTTVSLYARGVAELIEFTESVTCRFCGAAVTQQGTFDYENVDVDYVSFACGAEDGLQYRPCPKDPRFPSFSDYRLNFEQEGDRVYCYAHGTTDMARAVYLSNGFGETRESAAKWVERSFIALRDGSDAAEAFYPMMDHR